MFSFWVAAAVLLSSGWGDSILGRYSVSPWWFPAVMLLVAASALTSNLVHPLAVNLGSVLWSAAVITLWIEYGRAGQWMWLVTFAFLLSIARMIGPLNPTRVQVIAWLPWEAGVVGILAGLTADDPVCAVLVGAGSEIGSGVMLSLYSGHVHWGTVRDLTFSVAVSLVAWHSAVAADWWKHRRARRPMGVPGDPST